MSASQTPPGSNAPAAAGGDPSMEDILASIRRILSEDEAPAANGTAPAAHEVGEAAGDGVLVLDPAMMVPDPAHEAEPVAPPAPAPAPPPVGVLPPAVLPPAVLPPVESPAPVEDELSALVAPETAAAAASSVGSLVRTLMTERTMQVRSGGPTIEDIVREELRPLLRVWLDANLPPMVERLVRVEIERVVSRVVP